jgi:hypothetical protein
VSAVRSFWRVLLVWLTVLAIPVQGVAAARMTHCLVSPAPVHQHGAHDALEGHGHPHEQQGHHDHAAVSGSAHAGAHGHPVPAAAITAENAVVDVAEPGRVEAMQATPAASPQNSEVAGIDQTCSVCAACCAATALPTHVAELPMPDLVSTPMGLVDVTSISFIASGPERPPRAHLA